MDDYSTLLVEPNCLATAFVDGNIKIVLKGKSTEESSTKVDHFFITRLIIGYSG